MKIVQKYDLCDADPIQRAHAWDMFRMLGEKLTERKQHRREAYFKDKKIDELKPAADAGRRFIVHAKAGHNGKRHAKANAEKAEIRAEVEAERTRLDNEYKKAGRSGHGAAKDAIKTVARNREMSESAVKKRYYSK